MELLSLIENHELVVLDGAMGTRLASRGLSMSGQNNLTNPDRVLEIHKAYCVCGSQILITNTLTMNRIFIGSHKIDVDIREVNLAGAKLAKKAAGNTQFVLGDMSSTGQIIEPYGDLSEATAFESFKEQATFLFEGGVDGIIVETMFDLREALCALRACKEVSSKPVIVSMAFSSADKGGRTIMGNSAEDCAKILTESGAQAIGMNCGDIDPFQMADIVSTFRNNTDLPILVQPNAGIPQLIDNNTVFSMSPREFANGVIECINNSASIVGGCCGTTPGHISAVIRTIG